MPAEPGAPPHVQPDASASTGATGALPLHRLTSRSEFLAANAGIRVPMPAFVLIVHPRADGNPSAGFGITATRKLGGAVIRNRAKRRLRAAVRATFPAAATAGANHVLIARADVLTLDYRALTADLGKALAKAPKRLAERAKGPVRPR